MKERRCLRSLRPVKGALSEVRIVAALTSRKSVPRYEAFTRVCVYGVTRQCLCCESLGGAAAGVLINVPIDRSLKEGEVKVHSLWPKVTEPGSGF